MMPEAASSAILIRDGKILLIRRRNPPSFDMFAFPGGRAEPGETPAGTALREFHEETGIRAHTPREFAFYDLRAENPGRHFHLTVFLVEAGWFTPSEIRLLNTPPSVLDCLDRLEREILFS